MDLSLSPPHPQATPSPHILNMPSFSPARWHSAHLAVSLLSQLKTSGTQVLWDFQIREVGAFSLNIFSIVRKGFFFSHSLHLFITLSLFATKTAVVILRGSCVNSVFSSTVNDNSALPVSPSAQADTHSSLLSSLNYLPLIQIRKLKSRSSMKALCWVMRETHVCKPKCACMRTCVNLWVCVCMYFWAHTECWQDRTLPKPSKALFSKESFNLRAGRGDLNSRPP